MTEPPRPPGDGTQGPEAAPPPPETAPPPPETAPPPPETAPPPPETAPPPPPLGAGAPSGGFPPPGVPPPGGFPPPAGYPPPGGYPAGPGAAPPGYPSNEDKTWALLAHFLGPVGVVVSGGVLGWVGPLIAMLVRGNQSPVVRGHAVAALNFQLTWAIVIVASWLLAAITCGLLAWVPLVLWILPVAFGIVGGVKANDGQLYRYPLTINLVK